MIHRLWSLHDTPALVYECCTSYTMLSLPMNTESLLHVPCLTAMMEPQKRLDITSYNGMDGALYCVCPSYHSGLTLHLRGRASDQKQRPGVNGGMSDTWQTMHHSRAGYSQQCSGPPRQEAGCGSSIACRLFVSEADESDALSLCRSPRE
jgi:hypothetical protein